MEWNEALNECSRLLKEEQDRIINQILREHKVIPGEVWLIRDDCGHSPYIYDSEEGAYNFIKQDLTKELNHYLKDEEKYKTEIEDISETLDQLEKDYRNNEYWGEYGGWTVNVEKVYKNGELPDYY